VPTGTCKTVRFASATWFGFPHRRIICKVGPAGAPFLPQPSIFTDSKIALYGNIEAPMNIQASIYQNQTGILLPAFCERVDCSEKADNLKIQVSGTLDEGTEKVERIAAA
jgi:hypothetical protein